MLCLKSECDDRKITDRKADTEYPATYKDFPLKDEISVAAAYPITTQKQMHVLVKLYLVFCRKFDSLITD